MRHRLTSGVLLITLAMTACGTDTREWMKLNQTYTTAEFRRDLQQCTVKGKLDDDCMKARGWVAVGGARGGGGRAREGGVGGRQGAGARRRRAGGRRGVGGGPVGARCARLRGAGASRRPFCPVGARCAYCALGGRLASPPAGV